ncbi:MAG TPA: VWA domain-containing protein [Blastocatellia bacterium]|jgi:VWFA-related protein|nr:VWA domain-containing protein [Blastocatellia bacterium]
MNQLAALRSVAILIFSLAFSLTGQPWRQDAPDEQTLRLRADLVVIDLLPVQKKSGRILADLSKDDVVLYEDGVKQSVSHFSRGKEPVSILLLVDRAGCVNAFNEQIRAATVEAINRLKPEDEVAIMTFSNKVRLQQPFTRDRSSIADKIQAVETQHHSEQHYFNSGIYEAAEYMKKAANPAGRRVIIVLTSLEASLDFSKRSEKDALDALLESGASVSGVLVKTLGGRIEQALRGKPTSLLRHLGLRAGSLKKFVEETGGELVSEAPATMSNALNRMVDNVSASYSVAYTPTNSARDGKRRRIRVQASGEVEKREGKVVMLSRRSYIMPKETASTGPSTK